MDKLGDIFEFASEGLCLHLHEVFVGAVTVETHELQLLGGHSTIIMKE